MIQRSENRWLSFGLILLGALGWILASAYGVPAGAQGPKEIAKLKGSKVLFSPDGKTLIASGKNKTILYELPNLKERAVLDVEGFYLSITPDGKTLGLFDLAPKGSDESKAYVWDLKSGKQKADFVTGQCRIPASFALAPDGNCLYATGYGLCRWDIATKKEKVIQEKHPSAIVLTPDGKTLVAGYWELKHNLKVWDLGTEKEIRSLEGHTDWINDIVLFSDNKRLASASNDKTIKLWDLASGKELATLKGHDDSIDYITVSGDGKFLASSSSDKTVRLWNTSTFKELAAFKYDDRPDRLSLSRDGKLLAVPVKENITLLLDISGYLK